MGGNHFARVSSARLSQHRFFTTGLSTLFSTYLFAACVSAMEQYQQLGFRLGRYCREFQCGHVERRPVSLPSRRNEFERSFGVTFDDENVALTAMF
jgi:hypothetical protein